MKRIFFGGLLTLIALLVTDLAYADSPPFSATGQYMTGDWGGTRTSLKKLGYNFTLDYSSMMAANLAGGYDKDKTARYSDQFTFGADLNLEKILGISDGEFKTSLIDRNGRDLTQDRLQDPRAPVMGSGVQSNYGRGQTWHVEQFWYRQSWWKHALDIKLGLMPVGEDFDNNGCFFQNLSLCGALAGHGSGVWYNTPIGQWGTRLKYSIMPTLYAQVGAFQYNPNYATRHGSFELDGTGHQGYMYVAEIGYLPTFGPAALSGAWKAGAWYNTADANDVLDDDNGDPYVLSKNAPLQHSGRYGGYIYLLQQVTGTGKGTPRGLSLFWHLAINDRDTATMDYQTQLGAVYKGPFSGRPLDFIGLGVSKMHANSRLAHKAQLLNQEKGINDYDDPAYTPVRHSEYVTELNYSLKLTPWFTLRPNLQFLVHPGGVEEIKNAWVVGSQVAIRF